MNFQRTIAANLWALAALTGFAVADAAPTANQQLSLALTVPQVAQLVNIGNQNFTKTLTFPFTDRSIGAADFCVFSNFSNKKMQLAFDSANGTDTLNLKGTAGNLLPYQLLINSTVFKVNNSPILSEKSSILIDGSTANGLTLGDGDCSIAGVKANLSIAAQVPSSVLLNTMVADSYQDKLTITLSAAS